MPAGVFARFTCPAPKQPARKASDKPPKRSQPGAGGDGCGLIGPACRAKAKKPHAALLREPWTNHPVPHSPSRHFLLLQGPPGPCFARLAQTLAAGGAQVCRIHFHCGDAYDWRAAKATAPLPRATAYRGRASRWPGFIARFLKERGITDLVLFGDCRPLHAAAIRAARAANLRIHVLEEGYIRPDWLTLEQDGVNGHSSLPQNPAAIAAAALGLPPLPALPPIAASLGHRVRDTVAHFAAMWWGRPAYPFYRSHRPGSIAAEGLGWIGKYLTRRPAAARAAATLAGIAGQRYFLFPLQLSSDYQIRTHSPFATMQQAADLVLANFAAHAPPDCLLVIKEHPLDANFGHWRRYVAQRARALKLGGRLVHLAGGDLQTLAQASLGMVVVNSTSASFALAHGIAVKPLGRAIYALPGLVHPGPLSSFWTAPQSPDPRLWDAFVRVLHHRCLVRGGLASTAAVEILVANAARRLLEGE